MKYYLKGCCIGSNQDHLGNTSIQGFSGFVSTLFNLPSLYKISILPALMPSIIGPSLKSVIQVPHLRVELHVQGIDPFYLKLIIENNFNIFHRVFTYNY